MKTKNYMLAFVILMICAVPLCVYGAEPAEPNVSNPEHDSKRILKSKVEAEQINNNPNKHKGGMSHIENDKESLIMKIWQMQYTQLLEVHRSYFMAFLQVLAIYLAVMGACLKFVCDSIENLEDPNKKGSKTVLLTLITFAVITSSLFLLGLRFGEGDAVERNCQIAHVAKLLCIVKPVNTELITRLFSVMAIGTALIVIGWYVMFIRGLKAARKKLRWYLIIETGILLICWLVVSLGYLQNLCFMILIGIVTLLIIGYWLFTLVRDRQEPLGTP